MSTNRYKLSASSVSCHSFSAANRAAKSTRLPSQTGVGKHDTEGSSPSRSTTYQIDSARLKGEEPSPPRITLITWVRAVRWVNRHGFRVAGVGSIPGWKPSASTGGTSLEEGWKDRPCGRSTSPRILAKAEGIARQSGFSSELARTMPTVRYFDLWLRIITISRNST